MRFRFLSVLAAGLLLAACASKPQDTQASSASGSTTTGAGSTVTSSSIVPGSQQDLAQNVGDRVFFGFDKYDLSPEAQATLERQAAWS